MIKTILTIIAILNCIALVGCLCLVYMFGKLKCRYEKLSRSYKHLVKEYNDLLYDSIFVDSKVFVTEEHNNFVVGRDGRHGQTFISVIPFNPDDIDDKEYKRIHAEEIAEILNEKP